MFDDEKLPETVTFQVVWPISKKNSRVTSRKTGRSFPSARYSAWHKTAEAELKKDFPEIFAEPRRYESVPILSAVFFAPDMRRRDLTNLFQSIEDLLTDVGFWVDDNYFVVGQLHLMYGGLDRKFPRVVVTAVAEVKRPSLHLL